MDAKAIIAQAVCERFFNGNTVSRDDEIIAGIVSHALTAAGFTIIHRDENHGPTLERAAAVAKSAFTHGLPGGAAEVIAAAIRAMGEKK